DTNPPENGLNAQRVGAKPFIINRRQTEDTNPSPSNINRHRLIVPGRRRISVPSSAFCRRRRWARISERDGNQLVGSRFPFLALRVARIPDEKRRPEDARAARGGCFLEIPTR